MKYNDSCTLLRNIDKLHIYHYQSCRDGRDCCNSLYPTFLKTNNPKMYKYDCGADEHNQLVDTIAKQVEQLIFNYHKLLTPSEHINNDNLGKYTITHNINNESLDELVEHWFVCKHYKVPKII